MYTRDIDIVVCNVLIFGKPYVYIVNRMHASRCSVDQIYDFGIPSTSNSQKPRNRKRERKRRGGRGWHPIKSFHRTRNCFQFHKEYVPQVCWKSHDKPAFRVSIFVRSYVFQKRESQEWRTNEPRPLPIGLDKRRGTMFRVYTTIPLETISASISALNNASLYNSDIFLPMQIKVIDEITFVP